MPGDLAKLEECLCACRFDDTEPMTFNERLVETLKVLGVAIMATTVVALAVIGLLDVGLAVYFS